MNFIFSALNALKEGELLENPATWKNVQILGTALSAVLTFLVLFMPKQYAFTPDQIQSIITGIIAFTTVWNSYFTTATTGRKTILSFPVRDNSNGGDTTEPAATPTEPSLIRNPLSKPDSLAAKQKPAVQGKNKTDNTKRVPSLQDKASNAIRGN